MTTKKIMLSQPMDGLTERQILQTRDRFMHYAEKEGLKIMNTQFLGEFYSEYRMRERGIVQIPVYFLAKTIEVMSQCHVVFFAKGWERARGCKIEHKIALKYNLEIIYENKSKESNMNDSTPNPVHNNESGPNTVHNTNKENFDVTGSTTPDQWGAPYLVDIIEKEESLELIYKEKSLITYTTYPPQGPEERVFKVVYSCKNGAWHKSRRFYGIIVPAKKEEYIFNENRK